jgi:hypothetical protein
MRLSLRPLLIAALGWLLAGCSLNPRGELPSAGEGSEDGLLEPGAAAPGSGDFDSPSEMAAEPIRNEDPGAIVGEGPDDAIVEVSDDDVAGDDDALVDDDEGLADDDEGSPIGDGVGPDAGDAGPPADGGAGDAGVVDAANDPGEGIGGEGGLDAGAPDAAP